MIAIDTSALMAIVFDEPAADACIAAIETDGALLLSAGTMAEALIVANRRGVASVLAEMLAGLEPEIAPVTAATARRIAAAYERWGKGRHAAGLNFGDCFAYVVAKEHGCPLLFVGDDFARTDVASALA